MNKPTLWQRFKKWFTLWHFCAFWCLVSVFRSTHQDDWFGAIVAAFGFWAFWYINHLEQQGKKQEEALNKLRIACLRNGVRP